MGKIITSHAVYGAWDYESEIDALNQKSREGLQLVKGGCFQSKFEEDSSVVFRYQIDFNRKIDNKMRYIEFFREQGWEFINSTFNGWHYFRKPYDLSKDDEEYEIYTDRPSKAELLNRWLCFAMPLTIFVLIVLVLALWRLIALPEPARIGIVIEYAAILAMLIQGCLKMQKAKQG